MEELTGTAYGTNVGRAYQPNISYTCLVKNNAIRLIIPQLITFYECFTRTQETPIVLICFGMPHTVLYLCAAT